MSFTLPPMNPGAYWDTRYTKGTIYGESPAGFMNEIDAYIQYCRKVLVVGGGYGRNAAFLAQNGRDVVSSDISNEAINIGNAHNTLKNLRFQLLNIVKANPRKHQFDAVVAIYLLSLIVEKDVGRAMTNINKFLPYDGRFVCNFLSTEDDEYLENQHSGTIVGENALLVDDGKQYIKFYTKENAEHLLHQHRFTIDRIVMAEERRFINILKKEITSRSWLAFCRKSTQ